MRPRGAGASTGLSPVTHSILRIPNAVAPNTSACRLARVRSRAAICMTGSAPCSRAILLQAQEVMRGVAEALSVKFMAVTYGLTSSMLLISLLVETESGGAISQATTNFPARRARSRGLTR